MKIYLPIIIVAVSGLITPITPTMALDLVLSERIMELSKLAAELSALAYEEDPPGDAYDQFGFYDAEPDQALIAYRAGYCFGAFRGTTLTWDDWRQNLQVGMEEICPSQPQGAESSCCTTRIGFWTAYNTNYRDDMEKALRNCAKQCDNQDECVVLTGHSQGGAIAAVAGVYLADLNPLVLTFGQPPTIEAPCDLITSERWFRYVNTKDSGPPVGISYDPVPFLPGLGADNWGHMILLSDDTNSVAYIGLDVQDQFHPLNVHGFEAHSMIAAEGVPFPGYLDRIESLMSMYQNGTYPVITAGYVAGSLCSQDKECASGLCEEETGFALHRCVGTSCERSEECDSGRCDSGLCIPQLGSCMQCDEHSDCTSGVCSFLYRCAGEGGLMDNDCKCILDSDCKSGRCEGYPTSRVCEAQLGLGARCNEDTDCISGDCSWRFRCVKPSRRGIGAVAASLFTATRAVDFDEQGDSAAETRTSSMLQSLSLSAVAIVAMAGVSFRYFRTHRRRGYEQLPANVSV